MLRFGSGLSGDASAAEAARRATAEACAAFREAHPTPGIGVTPKLAILFASLGYQDVAAAAAVVGEALPNVPIVGGSSGGGLLGPEGVVRRGVSVILIGGDDVEVANETAEFGSAELVRVVPAVARIASAADEAARRGFKHFTCLVFAPGIFVDGEALVAAVRKGAGPRAQLAGGLTGDELTMDRPIVFARGESRSDRVVVAGLFTKKPVGIAARHGWQAVGPVRVVTRADGPRLIELDNRPALAHWLEDARRAGADFPERARDLARYLGGHYEIGIETGPTGRMRGELVARAPWSIADDGALIMSGSIAEGSRVRLIQPRRKDLLRAATAAASEAVMRAGTHVAGALVLACSGRLAALGDEFPAERVLIRERVGAPIGGACVYGEIAKNERDLDAFFNTTVVVVAFAG